MNTKSKQKLFVGLLGLGLAAAGWKAGSVYADFGIPSPGALSYKGTLQSGNVAFDGVADFSIALFDSPTMDSELCRVDSNATPVSGGRFEVELSDACTEAVENNDETWILVTVDAGDGSQSFAIERIHASAYAVSAKKADTAHNGVPVGGIIWWSQPGGAAVPDGFQVCNGSQVTTGPMAGTNTPNLIGRFARGAASTNLQSVAASSTTTSTNGEHDHLVAAFIDVQNSWFTFSDGDLTELYPYGDGIGPEGSGQMPLGALNGNGDQFVVSDIDGDHSHTIAEPVPSHVPLVPLMRIR